MEKTLLIAGFGGQGVMLIGKTLGYAATKMGLYATFFPAYGAEQRGGTANCSVIVSDKEIVCPLYQRFDNMIIMNELSFSRFGNFLSENGMMIINSSLVSSRPSKNKNCFLIDTDAVSTQVGSRKVANMIALGAYLKFSGTYDLDAVKSVVKHLVNSKPDLIELNIKALEAGYSLL